MKFEKLDAKGSVERARRAQSSFEFATQERADAAVKAVCRVTYLHAEELAKMAVEETRMGNYDHKVEKIKGKAPLLWQDLKTKKTVGIINKLEDRCMWELAKPVGVVAGVTPCTNPVVTVMSNASFALKCRNAIIFAPHPRAAKLTDYMMELYGDALEAIGEDRYLVQTCIINSEEDTKQLMGMVDVVVATGGPGMVKSAYSSGKPAYGVGPGNVQCIIDKGYDYDKAAVNIVNGRSYDCGILCTCEQAAIIPEDDYDRVISALQRAGAYMLNTEEQNELRKLMFPDGKTISRAVVGQTAAVIAELAGIAVPEGTKVLMVKPEGTGGADCFGKEKMCPVLAIYSYKTFEDGVATLAANLHYEGEGHSANIYTENEERLVHLAERANVSRLVVNHSSSSGAGGNVWNGFTPTNTLGCGSWGGNSFSDNFTYKYLMNTTRVGFRREKPLDPRPEDLMN